MNIFQLLLFIYLLSYGYFLGRLWQLGSYYWLRPPVHEPHVTWQGEALGTLVSRVRLLHRTRRPRLKRRARCHPQPWTTNRNWPKNSPSSRREGTECWYVWTTLKRWGRSRRFEMRVRDEARNKELDFCLLRFYLVMFSKFVSVYIYNIRHI